MCLIVRLCLPSTAVKATKHLQILRKMGATLGFHPTPAPYRLTDNEDRNDQTRGFERWESELKNNCNCVCHQCSSAKSGCTTDDRFHISSSGQRGATDDHTADRRGSYLFSRPKPQALAV